MSLTPPQLLTRTQTMMQLVDTRWRSQLAILLENIEALKTDNSAWEETPAGKAITYQLRDYRGAYLFSKLISEAFLPGHGFPVGVVNFNYLTADELERRRAIKATQADPNEGEKTFLAALKNCPAVTCPQHYVNMLTVLMWYWAEKYIVPRVLCLVKYLPAGGSCLAIIIFRGSGIAVNAARERPAPPGLSNVATARQIYSSLM